MLTAPVEVALERVATDPERAAGAISRDPTFVRAAHAAFAALALPAVDAVVDTSERAPGQIADELARLLDGSR